MKKRVLASILLSIVVMISGCSTSKTVLTVGSQKVTIPEFEFYLNSVKTQMQGTELTSDEDWQSKEIEGKKAIDLAKERAMETAVSNVAYIEVGEKLGLGLTDDDKKNIESYKQRIITSYGGQTQYESFLKSNNLNDDFVQMLCESMEYTEKLKQKLKQDAPVTEDEMGVYFREHYRRAKHVLILTQDMNTQTPYTAEKKAESKQRADSIYKRALEGENFETLVSELSEDPGSKSNPDGYVFTDGEMVDEFTNGVDSLQPGNITMVESDFGYHIIKRYAIDETLELYQQFLTSKKQNVEQNVITDKLEKQMEVWKTQLGIEIAKNEDVYSNIK